MNKRFMKSYCDCFEDEYLRNKCLNNEPVDHISLFFKPMSAEELIQRTTAIRKLKELVAEINLPVIVFNKETSVSDKTVYIVKERL